MSVLARADATTGADAQTAGRILIVDDIADNRNLLARRLKSRNFETVEACGGYEALKQIEQSTFDTVLLDVMMPDITGTEVLRRLRERYSANVLPVIMVTAKVQSEDLIEALDLGANDYITKPIDFPVVLARVTTQIERRRTALALEISKKSLVEHNARLLEANARLQEEIALRLEADSKSTFLAYHDSLTGLANRHACDERLPELMSSIQSAGKGLAVLLLDLDGFKNINDALGHPTGDALIKSVAAAMLGAVQQDDLLIRLGGDEFCIVHISAEPETTAVALAERLIKIVRETRIIEGNEIFVGVSVGIAVLDAMVKEASELLKRADTAMYCAKLDGRGVWRMFRDEMGEAQRRRHMMQLDLRNAIQRSEFDLHFQPIINLKTGRISCFEALLRWSRRPDGPIAPDQFIPLAEDTGLIVPIGDWVLRRACEEAARWPQDIRIAVNVSPVQFRGKHILTSLVSALARSGVAPERLELEITESVMLRNSEETIEIMKECRALGIRLAMDDFGTGYSSLAYLSAFRFDKVKIDRSFISGEGSMQDSAVVRAIVGLGKSFGMTTTAEGVETDEQLAYLLGEGCCEGQGYLLGRPRSAVDVLKLLERRDAPMNAL